PLDAAIARLRRAAHPAPEADLELETATAALHLLDAERALGEEGSEADRERLRPFLQRLGAQTLDEVRNWIELVKHWTALRLKDPDFKHWVSFRFAGPVDHFNLVRVTRPAAETPELMQGPEERLRRRDGFVLTDSRMQSREV